MSSTVLPAWEVRHSWKVRTHPYVLYEDVMRLELKGETGADGQVEEMCETRRVTSSLTRFLELLASIHSSSDHLGSIIAGIHTRKDEWQRRQHEDIHYTDLAPQCWAVLPAISASKFPSNTYSNISNGKIERNIRVVSLTTKRRLSKRNSVMHAGCRSYTQLLSIPSDQYSRRTCCRY